MVCILHLTGLMSADKSQRAPLHLANNMASWRARGQRSAEDQLETEVDRRGGEAPNNTSSPTIADRDGQDDWWMDRI